MTTRQYDLQYPQKLTTIQKHILVVSVSLCMISLTILLFTITEVLLLIFIYLISYQLLLQTYNDTTFNDHKTAIIPSLILLTTVVLTHSVTVTITVVLFSTGLLIIDYLK